MAGCAALYALSILALRVSHMGHGWPFVDLVVYRQGGEATLAGGVLYALRFPGALAFTYSPVSALLFTALVPWRMAVLEPLVTAASMLLLPVTLALALRLRPARTWLTRGRALCLALLASAGALWLEPVWTAIRYGQIDLLIAALVLYDLSRDRSYPWQGAAIGLAVGLKLTPRSSPSTSCSRAAFARRSSRSPRSRTPCRSGSCSCPRRAGLLGRRLPGSEPRGALGERRQPVAAWRLGANPPLARRASAVAAHGARGRHPGSLARCSGWTPWR